MAKCSNFLEFQNKQSTKNRQLFLKVFTEINFLSGFFEKYLLT